MLAMSLVCVVLMISRDVQNRFFYFGLVSIRFFEKNLDLVWNEFGLVRLTTRFGSDIILVTSRVIAEKLIYSKYYSDSGLDDFDVTHSSDKK